MWINQWHFEQIKRLWWVRVCVVIVWPIRQWLIHSILVNAIGIDFISFFGCGFAFCSQNWYAKFCFRFRLINFIWEGKKPWILLHGRCSKSMKISFIRTKFYSHLTCICSQWCFQFYFRFKKSYFSIWICRMCKCHSMIICILLPRASNCNANKSHWLMSLLIAFEFYLEPSIYIVVYGMHT